MGFPFGSLALTERTLRRIILALIFTFLICLGAGTIANLMSSRAGLMQNQSRLTMLYADAAMRRFEDRMVLGIADGGIPRIPTDADLGASLPEGALASQRTFLVTDHAGYIRATAPEGARFAGLLLTDVLGERDVERATPKNTGMEDITLPDGTPAFAFVSRLEGLPGTFAVIQPHAALTAGWQGQLLSHITLFATTALVLLLIGTAFHWQSARAQEADATLALAASRLDAALDRGHCGLWDWDVARGHIFWSRSMFGILGLPPRADLLSYGEVLELLHPDDKQIDAQIDEMLKEGRTTPRPRLPDAACGRPLDLAEGAGRTDGRARRGSAPSCRHCN